MSRIALIIVIFVCMRLVARDEYGEWMDWIWSLGWLALILFVAFVPSRHSIRMKKLKNKGEKG